MTLQLSRLTRLAPAVKSASRLSAKARSHSLLLRLLIGGVTLVASAAAYFSYQGARELMLDNLKNQALLEVQQGANEIDIWLGQHKVSLAASANSPTFRTMDWSQIEPYLKSEERRLSEFLYLGMIDRQGFLYTTVVDQPNGKINLQDRQHVQGALAGENSLSNPLIARIPEGARVIAYAIPVWSGQPELNNPLGSVIGMMNGVIMIDRVVEVVNGLQYGDGSYAFALNSQGEAIVHPDPELMSTLEKPADSLINSPDPGLATISQKMVAGSTGLELVTIDGVPKYVAFLPLQEADWSVALAIPRENIESQLRQLDLVALTVAGLAGSMIVILWWVQSTEQTYLKRSKQAADAAKEAADSANQAKSEFLANMSHELRTPLNGILGYAQILQRSNTLAHHERRGVGIIEQCGAHLLTLINDVLDLSKIEARKLELAVDEFHFPSFLQSVAEMCRVRADQKGIGFTYQIDTDVPTGIQADEKRLRQVLINLLSNAIKFTETGSVTFWVKAQKLETAGMCRLRFQIKDTGVGMTPEQVKKIFRPFEQVGDSKKRAEGTGLGLAISQKIVSLMGSHLEVQSEVGQGSTFWFDVDLRETQDWAIARTPNQGTIVGYEGQRRRILVVDDRWENRSVVTSLLEPLGFEVIAANDGQAGWEAAIAHIPDVIITDLMMPVMDGYQLLQRLRESETTRDIVAIASSASVFESNQHEAIDAGANVFLPKPIQAPLLFKTLQAQLSLDWVYKQETSEQPESDAVPLDALVAPAGDGLQQLYTLVQDGDTQGIVEIAAQLSASDPALTPFVQQITELANRFQLKQLQTLIERYLD
ncbi:MAG: ATP-binding protein [Cyanobacteria bacterium P01_G01_bin.38]